MKVLQWKQCQATQCTSDSGQGADSEGVGDPSTADGTSHTTLPSM